MENNQIFAVRLKKIRKSYNISINDTAKLIGLSSGSVNQFEQGKILPAFETFVNLLSKFGLSGDYLLGISDVPYTSESIKFAEHLIFLEFKKLAKLDLAGAYLALKMQFPEYFTKRDENYPDLKVRANIVVLMYLTTISDAYAYYDFWHGMEERRNALRGVLDSPDDSFLEASVKKIKRYLAIGSPKEYVFRASSKVEIDRSHNLMLLLSRKEMKPIYYWDELNNDETTNV